MGLLAAILPLATSCTSDCEVVTTCDADGRTLTTCVDGEAATIDCMAEHGQLCEAGACVDPWGYGSPTFASCAAHDRATPESLAGKAG